MQLTLLGTGNATVTHCYNTCFLLKDSQRPAGQQLFLVDGGGGNGLLQQLEKAGTGWRDIREIFVTHRHMDHITGIFWMLRMLLSAMAGGSCAEEICIYSHDEVIAILRTMAGLLLTPRENSFLGRGVYLIALQDGETREILGRPVTFFDIQSSKARQFGFSMQLQPGTDRRLVCCGDEPCSAAGRQYAAGAAWLLHEAFCMHADADRFHPHEKHHSTVRDACQLAEQLQVRSLVLYHTEDSHLQQRKALYTAEGRRYFSGQLYIPDDLETIELL